MNQDISPCIHCGIPGVVYFTKHTGWNVSCPNSRCWRQKSREEAIKWWNSRENWPVDVDITTDEDNRFYDDKDKW